jgi:hypothetical protein
MLSLKYINKYTDANRDYELVIYCITGIQFSDPFLFTISNSTDTDCLVERRRCAIEF